MWYAFDARRRLTRDAWMGLGLAAALAACSDENPTSPLIRDRSSGVDTVAIQTAQASATATAISTGGIAYLWADQPVAASYMPDSLYSYNGSGGPIRVTRQGTGRYLVHFDGNGASYGRVGFAIGAQGSSTVSCSVVRGIRYVGTTLEVPVRCWNFVTEALANARYTLLLVDEGFFRPNLAFAYAYADQPSNRELYTPDESYTSGPGYMLIARGDFPGGYSGNLGNGDPLDAAYLVHSALDRDSGSLCALTSGSPFLRVQCYNRNGQRADETFRVLQLERGRLNRRFGYAVATNTTSALYTPPAQTSHNSSGGAIRARRLGVGEYAMEFDGLQRHTISSTENVQVSTWGALPVACKVRNWLSVESRLRVNVRCWSTITGAPADARYSVLVIE